MDGQTPDSHHVLLDEIDEEAGQVLAPPPGHPRFGYLDSIRALAAISVLLFHVTLFTGGFQEWYLRLFAHLDIGVPIFFLLSGFLIYRPFLASRILGLPQPKIVNYARNRFFRIMPLFWIALTVSAIVPGMYGAFTGNWWVYYSLLQNFPIYDPTGVCRTIPVECAIPVVWSLSIEVMFYILLPFYSLAMASVFGKTRRLWFLPELLVLGALTLISFKIQSTFPFGGLHNWLYYSPLGRAWWFTTGLSLAVLSVHCQGRETLPRIITWLAARAVWLWVLAFGLYALLCYVILNPSQPFNVPVFGAGPYLWGYLISGVIAVLIAFPAIFVTKPLGLTRRLMGHPILTWLGLISYGIFLWQIPVFFLLKDKLGLYDFWPVLNRPIFALLVLGTTVAISAASYYAVERPVMLWSRSRGKTSGS